MINVLFFASLKEALATDKLTVSIENATSVELLLKHLKKKGAIWEKSLSSGQLMMAVNQEMVQKETLLHSGDEVAFFPPVTGG